MKGYTAPEKVHTLSPEMHMEVNNLWDYKSPRTPFYIQTEAELSLDTMLSLDTNQDKLEKIQRFDNNKKKDVGPDLMGGYVHDFVKANTGALPLSCRAIDDKGTLPARCINGHNTEE